MSAETVTGPHESTITRVRHNLAADLLDLHAQLHRAHQGLPLTMYGDPSQLGADRARLNLAARLVNEVAATLADLTFVPSLDSGEEG